MEEPILQAFFSMGIVVVALLLILYFLKKYAKNRKINAGELGIEIVSKTSILPKSHLFVIKAENRTLLVGAGESGVSLIADLTDEQANAKARRTAPDQYKLPTSGNSIAMARQAQKQEADLTKVKKIPNKPKTRKELEQSLSFGSFLKSAFKRA